MKNLKNNYIFAKKDRINSQSIDPHLFTENIDQPLVYKLISPIQLNNYEQEEKAIERNIQKIACPIEKPFEIESEKIKISPSYTEKEFEGIISKQNLKY